MKWKICFPSLERRDVPSGIRPWPWVALYITRVLYIIQDKTHAVGTHFQNVLCYKPVLRIRIRIRIHVFLGLQDPDPDPLVRGMDPDPSIIMQK
jgi:hypothetical protein